MSILKFSRYDINKIQNHLPGWEKDWECLAEDLIGENPEKGPLYQVCIQVVWGKAEMANELLAETLSYFDGRIRRKTLFQDYDGSQSPIEYLCKYHRIHNCYRTWRKKGTVEALLNPSWQKSKDDTKQEVHVQSFFSSQDGFENKMTIDPSDSQLPQAVLRELIQKEEDSKQKIERIMRSFLVDYSGRSKRIKQLTGIQLYFRLLRENEEMRNLLQDTLNSICLAQNLEEPATAEAQLRAKHADAEAVYNSQTTKNYICLKEDKFKSATRDQKRLSCLFAIAAAQAQWIFFPIASAVLAELLNMLPNTASQNLSRYCGALQEGSLRVYTSLGAETVCLNDRFSQYLEIKENTEAESDE